MLPSHSSEAVGPSTGVEDGVASVTLVSRAAGTDTGGTPGSIVDTSVSHGAALALERRLRISSSVGVTGAGPVVAPSVPEPLGSDASPRSVCSFCPCSASGLGDSCSLGVIAGVMSRVPPAGRGVSKHADENCTTLFWTMPGGGRSCGAMCRAAGSGVAGGLLTVSGAIVIAGGGAGTVTPQEVRLPSGLVFQACHHCFFTPFFPPFLPPLPAPFPFPLPFWFSGLRLATPVAGCAGAVFLQDCGVSPP